MSRVKPPIPVFIGGTGRSGTTILGDLLGSHPDIALSQPTEIKFFSNSPGLINRCLGARNEEAKSPISLLHPRAKYQRWQKVREKRRESLKEFLEVVDLRWWKIDAPAPHGPGLVEGITRQEWEVLTSKLLKRFPSNPKRASAQFISEYITTQKNVSGEKYWVETTPFNIREADRITALLPQSKFIHMARDPRDVIASLMKMNWGPESPLEGIEWVEERLRAGHQALLNVDPSRVLHLDLESLTTSDRQASYKRLLDFLELADAPAMRAFFEQKVTENGAKSGRWRQEISEPGFEAAFEAMAERLTAEGVAFYRG